MIQDVPLCWSCVQPVRPADLIFTTPCGHDTCPSVVMHPLCLMEFRENRERQRQDLGRFLQGHEIVALVVRERDRDVDNGTAG